MQLEVLRKLFPDNTIVHAFDEYTLLLESSTVHSGLSLLKNHSTCVFTMLLDVTAVDYLHFQVGNWAGMESPTHSKAQKEDMANGMEKRFAVIYHLLSLTHKKRLRVRVPLAEGETITSVGDLWQSAVWAEREVFDMFGIIFDNHQELERILTDYGFVGHPLRKDFAVQGDYALRYDASLGKVMKEDTARVVRTDIPKIIRYRQSKDA